MKHRIIISILWIVVVGWCLGAIPQTPTVRVEQSFHVADTHLTFTTRSVDEWEQFQLVMKLNKLSVEIAQAEAKGEHQYGKIKEFKKLSKQLKE